jgi:ergothioneine biosynthesis protein EgtB
MTSTAIAFSYRENLLERIGDARARTDELFRIVRPEALYDRPIAERHRIIFYLGHLEAFDWNLLQGPLGLDSFDPEFDKLFAFGIDPLDGGLPQDQPKDWPSVQETRHYNARLRQTLDAALSASLAQDLDLMRLERGRLLETAIEHRLMHAETLCYMLHQLPFERKFWRADAASPSNHPPKARMVEIPAGTATLGIPRVMGGPFGWDNEFEEHRVEVPAFAIDAYNVTNGDYLKFIQEGGYRDPSLWSETGWNWISSEGRDSPAFWIRRGDSWNYGTMFEEIPLPLDWPVFVSHEEASAYARWARKDLPSEAEWHRAACGTRSGLERAYPWGSQPPAPLHGNFDFYRWDATAVGAFPAGSSEFGVADLVGNGWEWTRTIFSPFAGFEAAPFYPGYSANFFDGKHYVMKGGSPRTAACMLRRSFRNWFQTHYPYVYATFRGVKR